MSSFYAASKVPLYPTPGNSQTGAFIKVTSLLPAVDLSSLPPALNLAY